MGVLSGSKPTAKFIIIVDFSGHMIWFEFPTLSHLRKALSFLDNRLFCPPVAHPSLYHRFFIKTQSGVEGSQIILKPTREKSGGGGGRSAWVV